MADRMHSSVTTNESILKWLLYIPKILRRDKAYDYLMATKDSVPILSANAKLIIERAKGQDLESVSPLGALQLSIERVNEEARNEALFKAKLAKLLFSQAQKMSQSQVEELWENSAERIVVNEIYTLIKMQYKMRKPITFRDALVEIYKIKSQKKRAIIGNVTRALIMNF